MNKPNNYDQTRAGGEYVPIELGGHRGIIKQVTETTSKSGKEMIIVSIDFAAEDKQPKYFEEQYRNDTRDEKKWPYQATQYIVTEDNEGNTTRSFKSFCTNFEISNGVTIKWGSNWGAQFKGRRIGVVYGEVEEKYNGEVKTRRRIRWFCDDHKATEQAIPEKQIYKGAASAAPADNADGPWMPTDFSEDELPFR